VEKYIEAIYELQLTITKLAAHIESELGTANTPGNINRLINGLSKDVNSLKSEIENLKNDSTRPDGINFKIQKLEMLVSTLEKELLELEEWKNEMLKIASIPQFEDMKKEIENQKTKWVVAGTIFAIAQIAIGFLIKYLIG
jgi:predicted RNase H-like nuclease (RuvC/YqgF family)